MNPSPKPKKKLLNALNKFDAVANKTSATFKPVVDHFVDYVRLNRPDNYSGFKNKVIDVNEFSGKHSFLKSLVLKSDTVTKTSNFVSRYLGGTTAMAALSFTKKALKVSIFIGAAGYLTRNLVNPEIVAGSKFLGVIAKVGLTSAVPYIAAGSAVLTGFALWAAYEVHQIRKAGTHEKRSQAHMDKMVTTMLEDGFGYSKKLNKLVTAYEKSFKPDFTPQQTQAIRDGLAQKRSESGIVADMTPSQAEAINKIVKTLTKQYFVPPTLALKAGLTMVVEMGGNVKALSDKLKSRHIEADWVDRFKMDPLATVAGSKANGKTY